MTLSAVIALLVVSGCAGTAQPSARHVQVVDGYELPPSYGAALDHSGNDSIFTVRVVGLGSPRQSPAVSPDSPHVTYVYTPVVVVVTSVLKNGVDRLRPGRRITLRVLGGVAGDQETINRSTAPPPAYLVGSTVQVFAQPPYRDPVTGEDQFVPNWSFVVRARSLVNLVRPDVELRQSEADAMAQEKAAFAGWLR